MSHELTFFEEEIQFFIQERKAIVQAWVEDRTLQEILVNYLDLKVFESEYASGIYDSMLEMIQKDIGLDRYCPLMRFIESYQDLLTHPIQYLLYLLK